MNEKLSDYSGELHPVLKYEDFSSETLVRLWIATAKSYILIDAIWMDVVRKRYGDEIAREMDMEVWRTVTPHDVGRITEAMNITGKDVTAVLKFLQVEPGAGAVFPECECELLDPNHGILTVKRCLGLEYCERHEAWDTLQYACEILDAECIPQAARCINPDIKVTALKLPPRQSEDEPACIWEFKLDIESG